MDRSRLLKIRDLKSKGYSYREIVSELHISFSDVSKALKGHRLLPESTPSATLQSTATKQVSACPPYIDKKNGTSPYSESIQSNIQTEKPRTLLSGNSNIGLYTISEEDNPDPGPSSSSKAVPSSPFVPWKIILLFLGIGLIIWLLKKMKQGALRDE
jgi:hypothetical protein